MPNQLKDRVAIITGAGRGIGREHALLFAAEGAKVVVNDLGGNLDGTGSDTTPAQQVVDEITAAGGEAVANYDDVSDFEGARRLVEQAVETYGDLHVLVNNAGILRDRMLANMSAEEWDAVVKVHLRGHFAPTRWAAAYWRDKHKAGETGKRAVINTSSTSGLFGNVGQTNYGSVKTAIATFSIIADLELRRYGVRVNAIAPSAATRLIGTIPGREGQAEAPKDEWSPTDPANVSPFVAYLATEDCPIHGRVFFVQGGEVSLFQPFVVVDRIEKQGRWTVEELREAAPRLQEYRFDYGHRIGEMLLGDRDG
ncbi:MAG TPA: SDR family oxidoreductase [Acidimicrobiales bacterium]